MTTMVAGISTTRSSKGLAAYFVVMALFLLSPIFIVVPLSFNDAQFLSFPPKTFSLRWYREYANHNEWRSATLTSFRIALAASVLAILAGTLAVQVLERGNSAWRQIWSSLFLAPIVVPHVFIALGVFILAIRFGLSDSEILLSCAHAMIALPYVVLIVGAAYKQVDLTLERAARVLGARPFQAFKAAVLPGLVPALVAAWVFAFFVSFDELIIAQFLLRGHPTLPMRIWADLQLEVSPINAAVASLLIVVTTIAMGAAELLRRRGERLRQDVGSAK